MKGEVTHVQEMKERGIGPDGKRGEELPSPHRLRDTFATAASGAGLETREVMVLMNHVLPKGDVTEGYIRDSEEHLRACTDRVAVFLTARL